MNDIKMLKIPYDVPPSMHYSKIKYWRSFLFFVAIFSLVFNVHLYQHLFLNSFILNHTSRLSSCKILLFLFFYLMSLIAWLNELFLGIFCLPFFLSLSHFDALSRSLSCLDVLAHFYAWWIFPFLMKSLLDESCIPLGMMNFRLFKLDAHLFFLSHW